MIRFIVAMLTCISVAYAQEQGVSVRFDKVPVADFAKVAFGDLLKKPFVIEDDVTKKTITAHLENVPPAKVAMVLATVLQNAGLDVAEDSGVVFIGSKKTEANDRLLTYRLRHRSAQYVREIVKDAFPTVDAMKGVAPKQTEPSAASMNLQNLLQGNGAQNGQQQQQKATKLEAGREEAEWLVFRGSVIDLRMLREVLAVIDQPSEQLYVRAVAYDVQIDEGKGSAIDVAVLALGGQFGIKLSGGVLSGGSGFTVTSSTIQAVASFLDNDGRFHAMSRPSVRVRSGSSARFSVGQEVPTLGAVVTNQGGATQSVTYRQAGTIFEVIPHARDAGVDVTLRQTISSFRATDTSSLNSPTLNKRELETELAVRPGDVVVVAGLDSDEGTDNQRSFFGFRIGNDSKRTQRQTLLLLEVQRLGS